VVVANILSNPLKVLAPLLTALVRPGGRLVLAGLLERQVDEVASAYPQFSMHVHANLDGWACLAGVKR
jgi:ribosomal protein L11 methyltransferase